MVDVDRHHAREEALMRTVKRGCVVLLVTLAWACSGNKGTGPSPTPLPSPTTTFWLTGNVSHTDTSAAVAGATVSIINGPNAGKSTTTDLSGNYTFIALEQSGFFLVDVSAANYISQYKGVTLTSNLTLNFSLRPQAMGITLNGRVTDAATGGPIAGAVVSINGRYRGMTDNSGNFSVAGFLDAGGNTDITYVSARDYVSDYRYIQGTIQNVRLYRIERIVAGESKLVTIALDDTLCFNSMQDMPGIGPDYLCRSVFVVAPSDGAVTIEAISTEDGSHPPLEVETAGVSPCCSMGNPTTIQVTAGTVIVVNVEMLSSSTSAQSFVVNTSLSPQ
jgi:hypothetical protein